MRFPSRITMSISLLALLALVSSFMLYGLLSRGTSTHAAAANSSGVTKGALNPSAVVDPTKLTLSNKAAAPGSTLPKGARRTQLTSGAWLDAPVRWVRRAPLGSVEPGAAALFDKVSFVGSTTAEGLSAPFVTPEDFAAAACVDVPRDSRP